MKELHHQESLEIASLEQAMRDFTKEVY
jgi:hypothetical protein